MVTGFTILAGDFVFANVISWNTDVGNAIMGH